MFRQQDEICFLLIFINFKLNSSAWILIGYQPGMAYIAPEEKTLRKEIFLQSFVSALVSSLCINDKDP